MLTQDVSRSGIPILIRDGRLLSSAVDPRREAVNWVQSHQALVRGAQAVCVLGLGSGYHLEALQAHLDGSAEILILEADREVPSAYSLALSNSASGSFLSRCVVFANEDELLSDGQVAKMICGPFVVLPFFPALQGHVELYRSVHEILLARTPTALRRILSARGEEHLFLNCLQQLSNVARTAPLSIHDILRNSDVRSSVDPGYRTQLLWKILGELIK